MMSTRSSTTAHLPPTDETHIGAQHFCQTVTAQGDLGSRPSVLVAGCGRGHEALFIRTALASPVIGVDLVSAWEGEAFAETELPDFTLLVASVIDLPFDDGSFDAVFYHHVIEHVTDPSASLRELARVLRPNGLVYVGTPNRHRAVGYLGSFDATPVEKLTWNIADYRARLRGEFRNDAGAHAGFSERELSDLLTSNFTDIRFLTDEYLRIKYGGRVPDMALRAVCSRLLREVCAPSVYAIARRRP